MELSHDIRIEGVAHVVSYHNGERRTHRQFSIPINLPPKLTRILDQFRPIVDKELAARDRTPKQWKFLIGQRIKDFELQNWVGGVIWFHFDGTRNSPLLDYVNSYNWNHTMSHTDLDGALDALEVPRSLCRKARFRDRALRIKVKEFLKRSTPINIKDMPSFSQLVLEEGQESGVESQDYGEYI